jgi:hypothetical protein
MYINPQRSKPSEKTLNVMNTVKTTVIPSHKKSMNLLYVFIFPIFRKDKFFSSNQLEEILFHKQKSDSFPNRFPIFFQSFLFVISDRTFVHCNSFNCSAECYFSERKYNFMREQNTVYSFVICIRYNSITSCFRIT